MDNIWVPVDETTDASGRYVANFIIGTVKAEEGVTPILLNTDVRGKVKHSTAARFFYHLSGAFVAQKYSASEGFLLFVGDGAPYICEASKELKCFSPRWFT